MAIGGAAVGVPFLGSAVLGSMGSIGQLRCDRWCQYLVKPDVRRLSAEYQQRIRATLAPTKAMLPLPWFSSLDRTTSLARVGAELGGRSQFA
jgi:hypothetical protein